MVNREGDTFQSVHSVVILVLFMLNKGDDLYSVRATLVYKGIPVDTVLALITKGYLNMFDTF